MKGEKLIKTGLAKMSEEIVRLSWNEFQSSTVKTFQNIQSDNHFTDVTLACGDGEQIAAHKVLLSSSSSFFRNILIKNPHQHPLIYLGGPNIGELRNIIKFIYSGEVEIDKDLLDEFLKLANDLEIEGLKKSQDTVKSKVNTHFPSDPVEAKVNKYIVEQTAKTCESDFENFDAVEENPGLVKDHIREDPENKINYVQNNTLQTCEFCNYKSNTNMKRHVKKMHSNVKESSNNAWAIATIEKTNKEGTISDFACDQCLFEANSGVDLMKHRRHEHPEAERSFNCIQCGKQLSTRQNLKIHQVVHSGVKFPCAECSHKSSTRSNLQRHTSKMHCKETQI